MCSRHLNKTCTIMSVACPLVICSEGMQIACAMIISPGRLLQPCSCLLAARKGHSSRLQWRMLRVREPILHAYHMMPKCMHFTPLQDGAWAKLTPTIDTSATFDTSRTVLELRWMSAAQRGAREARNRPRAREAVAPREGGGQVPEQAARTAAARGRLPAGLLCQRCNS
jgi:hypothetical protein